MAPSSDYEQVLLVLSGTGTEEVTGASWPARVVVLDDLEQVGTYVSAKPVSLLVVPQDTDREELERIGERQRQHSPQGQIVRLDTRGWPLQIEELGPWRGDDAPPPPSRQEWHEILISLLEFAWVGEITGLVGRSTAIASVIRTIMRVATSDVPVLIQGPSGTGKELVARGIHLASHRRAHPYQVVNTPGLTESLIESELFGYEKGAFTGAVSRRAGVFEAAGEGTIFLDEIGDLSRGLQSKLLRVLEQHEFVRVGGTAVIRMRARVLAATHVDLERAVAEGRFREDLYYRLKVVTVDVPPLQERPEDILPLLHHFVRSAGRAQGTTFTGFTEEALEQLERYPWPGNVRELRNLVEHLVLMHPDEMISSARLARIIEERAGRGGNNLPAATGKSPEQAEREMIFSLLQSLRHQVAHLDERVQQLAERFPPAADRSPFPQADRPADLEGEITLPLGLPLSEVERRLIAETLQRLGGDKRRTAGVLGIGLRTLYRRLKEEEQT